MCEGGFEVVKNIVAVLPFQWDTAEDAVGKYYCSQSVGRCTPEEKPSPSPSARLKGKLGGSYEPHCPFSEDVSFLLQAQERSKSEKEKRKQDGCDAC